MSFALSLSKNATDKYIIESATGTSYVDENDAVTYYSKKVGIFDESSKILTASEKLSINGSEVLVKNYDVKNRLTDVSDYVAQTFTEYTYDDFGNVIKVETAKNGNIIFAEDYAYNEYGKIAGKNITTSALNQAYSYTYCKNAAQNLDEITFGSSLKFKPVSDVNGRNTGKEIYDNGNKIAGEYISYRKVGDHATNMPSCVWFASGSDIKESLRYKYDRCGNICEITQNGHVIAKYKYDALNRLVREDNKQFGKTVLFGYDSNGNITERCEYAYTAKTGEELSELECTHYSYDYIGDKLVAYNGEAFVYNNLGAPTTYRNKTLQWQYGKLLTSFDGTTFAYDVQGKRISKGAINFVYDADGNLLCQSNGLQFIYDHSGVTGIIYDNKTYLYRKDVQGNIIAILDETGAVVVKYVYDAWGNHAVTIVDPACEALANLNPFRYRSYYYDAETGLYYLQTRYYDPELGRFISQDSIEYAEHETINGLNLYAYCGDNPVMNVDPTGKAWYDVLFKVLAIVAAVVTFICAMVFTAGAAGVIATIAFGAALGGLVGGFMNEAQGGSFMAGWIGGAISGTIQSIGVAIAPFTGAIMGGAIGSFAGTAVTKFIDRGLGNNSYSNSEIFAAATTAAIFSAITSVLTGYMNYALKIGIGEQVGGSILTPGFANALSGFFSAIDDAISYLLSGRYTIVPFKK